ncbi:MAG: RseC/MucC family positive regulator of sigma(E) [Prevotella sp.]|nr:RseC/MucC family positive regulator of sigma(E) [Prevotella sp.]
MNNRIVHSGIITDIDEHLVQVSIQQSSACNSCKVAAHCNAAESKEKVIDVSVQDASKYVVGQQVNISTSGRTGMMAVVWAYAMPLVLMLAVLFVSLAACDNETFSALLALLSLVPYYILIYVFRSRIREQVAFQIDAV